MSAPDGVVETLMGACCDYTLGPDAMRWAPPPLSPAEQYAVELDAALAPTAAVYAVVAPIFSEAFNTALNRMESSP